MSAIDDRLRELGIELPAAPAPAANYVPALCSGKHIFISGQVCFGADGKLADRHKGKLGAEVSDEMGREAARLCAINVLAQVRAAVGGDFSKVARCVRLGGFINVTSTYTTIPQIMNGASDFMVEVMGEAGRHVRSTVGVAQLPFDCAVEVEATFELA
ncbi:MAG: RidA family protein [Sphingobium sp.]